jgi:hypothetical protein
MTRIVAPFIYRVEGYLGESIRQADLNFESLRIAIVQSHRFMDLPPTMPWRLYSTTQALVHLWVMRSFAKYLERLS